MWIFKKMFKRIFTSLLFLSSVQALLAQGIQRASETDGGASWLVSVETKGKRVCAGVQVSEGWFLALARCVTKKKYSQYKIVFPDVETRKVIAEKRSTSLVLLKTNTNSAASGKFAGLASKKIPSKFSGSYQYYNWNKKDTITATNVNLEADSKCTKQGVDGKYKKKENFCFRASSKQSSKCSLQPGLPIFGNNEDTWLLIGLSTIETDDCDGSYRKAVRISKFRNWIKKTIPTVRNCGALPFVKKGKATLDDPLSTTVGSTASINCNVGYEPNKDSIICQQTGKWQTAKCNIIDCGVPPSISFGSVTSTSNTYGSTASVSCNAGYTTETPSIRCQATGAWDTAICVSEDEGGPCTIPGITSTEAFEQCAVLDSDGNYNLFWNVNGTNVTFEVHVRTRGWVGLGLSKTGKMWPGDVAVGWVLDDGTLHFADRHTVGYRMPVMDEIQNWFPLLGEENDFGTVLKFYREINTCDKTEDEIITDGTTRLIYAFGSSDPVDDNSIIYHGPNRGSKSVSLLSPKTARANTPADVANFDFLNSDFRVPSDTTTYLCRGIKLPFTEKHHMIKFEAVVTPGNEQFVHHILIYRCQVANPTYWDGKTSSCYDDARTVPQCKNLIIGWAIGGQPFYFPEDVGFAVGGPDDNSIYVMETHFDNPARRAGIIDNSGIRITVTNSLRKHEAGLIQLGHIVRFSQIIPPGFKEFITKSYCSSECLREGFEQSKLDEVKIIGAIQHSHLLGVAMTTRHFRDGTELKPLIDDPTYDFNFQDFRAFQEEVSVYPGDSFQVECTYDTTSRRTLTVGGQSTQNEMCLTFAYYYPRMKLEYCLSEPAFDAFGADLQTLLAAALIVDWTNPVLVNTILASIRSGNTHQACYGDQFQSPPAQYYKPVEPSEPYAAQGCS